METLNSHDYIIVVDDDQGLRDLLQRYLSEQGFEVATASDARQMDQLLGQRLPDLLILDLMLPAEDGLSIARRLRAQSDLPIIILSARGDEIDRIIGLEMGADDYLPKPFNPRELLARIHAVLRRKKQSENTDAPGRHELFHFGPYVLNLATRQLFRQEDKGKHREILLTSGEFNLLRLFVSHANRVLSRDQLMDMLKGYERSPFDRSIDIRVTRLRKKIENNPKEPRFLKTVWGKGYLFSV